MLFTENFNSRFLRRWSATEAISSQWISELLRSIEHWAGGTLAQSPESLQFIGTHYRLPAEPREIYQGKVSFNTIGRAVIEGDNVLPRTPFGFWPEPLAATAAALDGGVEAMDEILAWLHLARLIYGYTWRVLVDWRYFEEVRQHPRFQAFLAEEDALVDSIEGAIDRGEIPL